MLAITNNLPHKNLFSHCCNCFACDLFLFRLAQFPKCEISWIIQKHACIYAFCQEAGLFSPLIEFWFFFHFFYQLFPNLKLCQFLFWFLSFFLRLCGARFIFKTVWDAILSTTSLDSLFDSLGWQLVALYYLMLAYYYQIQFHYSLMQWIGIMAKMC